MTRETPRTLSPKTTLDHLRKDAKRWLKALRAGDASARERLAAAWPGAPEAPDAPGLRDIQHALAREYGHASWAALKTVLEEEESARIPRAEAVDIVLRHAWDGKNGWRGDARPAMRVLRLRPDIARDNIHIAAMCGELEAVNRFLAADPGLASAKGGPLDFEPLQYLAYGRLDLPGVRGNSEAIARTLLDYGADVNAQINDGWDNPFTVLTGVIGLGEGMKPPHPQDRALAALLIERGADPYDTQALYNTSIAGDDPFWMDMLYRESAARGGAENWRIAGKSSPGRPEYSTLDYLLGNAVNNGHHVRAQWLLDHGADPNGVNSYSKRPHHEEAQLRGDAEMLRILEAAGAKPVTLDGPGAFQAAVMRLDRDEAARLAAAYPFVLSHVECFAAARTKIEAVRLLLDLGADVNAKDRGGATPLHWAAYAGAMEMAELLIARGAEIDVRDRNYHSSPLGWAVFLHKPEMAALLAPLSRDTHSLAGAMLADRLRALLTEEPALANALAGSQNDVTPLLCLPDGEDAAAEIAAILLEAGADPKLGRREGLDAEAYARKRGLIDAADLIAAARGG